MQPTWSIYRGLWDPREGDRETATRWQRWFNLFTTEEEAHRRFKTDGFDSVGGVSEDWFGRGLHRHETYAVRQDDPVDVARFRWRTAASSPPWVSQSWWNDDPQINTLLPRRSAEDPTQIAFYASEDHIRRGRLTRMRPGRFLTKFFGHARTPKQIEYLADWFLTGNKPPREFEGTFGLATTEDDIVEVYDTDHVGSCMTGADAVRVYAAGDLAVAHWDVDGRVVARCLVWPEKKVYGRFYPEPDDDHSERDWGGALKQSLEAQGYTSERTSNGFEGARLLKIDADGGDWVMPYIDHGYGVSDAGDHWIMSQNGDYEAENTDGTLGGQHSEFSSEPYETEEEDDADTETLAA